MGEKEEVQASFSLLPNRCWPDAVADRTTTFRQGVGDGANNDPFDEYHHAYAAANLTNLSVAVKESVVPPSIPLSSAPNDLSLFVEAIEAMRKGSESPLVTPSPSHEEVTRKRKKDVADVAQVKKLQVAIDSSVKLLPDQGIQLQEYDILAGNRSKRAGNRRYREIIQECAIHVGEIEMRAVVAKVLEAIAPGRFIRLHGKAYDFLKEKDVIKKINNALRDAAGLNRRELKRQQKGGVDSGTKRKPTMGPPIVAVKVTPPIHAKKFETHSTDVLGGHAREHSPGNIFFHTLVSQYLAEFDTKDQDAIIDRIIAAVYSQTPAGRFLTPHNQSVLNEAEVKAKVWVTLNHEHQLTLEREDLQESTGGIISQARFDSDMTAAAAALGEFGPLPPFQLRTSDVLGGLGKLKSNPGNVLFRDLVTQYVGDFEASSQNSITTIMEVIRNQDPPGRFLTSDNQSTLSKSQARNKVRLALHNKFNKKRQEATNGQPLLSMTPIGSNETPIGKPNNTTATTNDAKRATKAQPIAPQSTDVMGELGKGQRHNPGNVFFNGLVSKHGINFYNKSSQNAIIQQIIDAVQNLQPPGRFLSPNNKTFLSKAKTHAKVWVALNREHQLLLEKVLYPGNGSTHYHHHDVTLPVVSSGSDEDSSRSPSDNTGAQALVVGEVSPAGPKRVLQSAVGWSLPGSTD